MDLATGRGATYEVHAALYVKAKKKENGMDRSSASRQGA